MIRKEKKGAQVKVTFVLPEGHSHQNPCVVGAFNHWDPTANPFKKRANKTFSTSVMLKPNQAYPFRYLDENGHWFNEAQADAFEANEFGSTNCVCHT